MSETPIEASIALVGNPNAGKTTLFNELTGQNQKIGNYSGATVAQKSGTFRTPHGHLFELIDLPGTYSLEANSPDEEITRDALIGSTENAAKPDLLLCVVDACQLERHLYLVLQVIALGYPIVVALNKIDSAEAQGLRLDPTALSESFGIPFVPISASTQRGLTQLKHALRHPFPAAPGPTSLPPLENENPETLQKTRLDFIHRAVKTGLQRPDDATLALSDRIDAHALHPLKGWLIFSSLMLIVFWSIFKLAETPMGWIESSFEWLGSSISGAIGQGDFQSLIVDGVIAGVGGVLIFLPQIILLFLFIALLESSGYMARAAYLMDGIMNKVGLSGKSFLPLLSGYACAIPGIMATRTIPNAKERLATILILPWTSCTARLPVYLLILPLIFTSALSQSLALFSIYALGTLTALLAAKILKPRLGKTEAPQFLLELPPYQKPQWSHILHQVWERAFAFIKKAGTIILGLSIILWFLNTYPKSDSEDPSTQQAHSFNGQIGKAIQPIVSPLGWDHHMGTAMIASFAAREVFRSSLAISYATDEEDGDTMRQSLSRSTRPDGSKLYTPLVGLSIIIFFIYALQCLPTTAVVRRETGSWKWALAQLLGMTLFAYLAALLVYQGGKLLGYS